MSSTALFVFHFYDHVSLVLGTMTLAHCSPIVTADREQPANLNNSVGISGRKIPIETHGFTSRKHFTSTMQAYSRTERTTTETGRAK